MSRNLSEFINNAKVPEGVESLVASEGDSGQGVHSSRVPDKVASSEGVQVTDVLACVANKTTVQHDTTQLDKTNQPRTTEQDK